MIKDDEGDSLEKHRRITVVGWSIIVMGITLVLVVVLWLTIGHIGPSYSSNLLIKQQEKLREISLVFLTNLWFPILRYY
jgi:hypothetical protein